MFTHRNESALPQSRAKTAVRGAIRIGLALVFLVAGGMKLAGLGPTVAVFLKIGLGDWFRYFAGVVEVASAVLLLWPKTVRLGAALLALTMLAALGAHLWILGGSLLFPGLLLVGSAYLAFFP